jgi:cytochrome b6-f complex iron-sulfur subunit
MERFVQKITNPSQDKFIGKAEWTRAKFCLTKQQNVRTFLSIMTPCTRAGVSILTLSGKLMTRRTFFQKLAAAVYGSTMLASIGSAITYLFPNKNFAANSNELEDGFGKNIPADAVPEGGHMNGMIGGKPVIVFRQAGSFVALSTVCTHLGCTVAYNPKERLFLCPCHGGEYDEDGPVLGGPPPSPLKHLQVKEFENQIILA